jgi:hypothetical protein
MLHDNFNIKFFGVREKQLRRSIKKSSSHPKWYMTLQKLKPAPPAPPPLTSPVHQLHQLCQPELM